jgi:hypothetical protein
MTDSPPFGGATALQHEGYERPADSEVFTEFLGSERDSISAATPIIYRCAARTAPPAAPATAAGVGQRSRAGAELFHIAPPFDPKGRRTLAGAESHRKTRINDERPGMAAGTDAKSS